LMTSRGKIVTTARVSGGNQGRTRRSGKASRAKGARTGGSSGSGSSGSNFGGAVAMINSDVGFQNFWQPTFNRERVRKKLRYGAAAIEFTAATSTLGRYVYSANGLFDPSITGGALQPAGFVQLMMSYNHYCVEYAKATIIFTNNTTTPTMVGIQVCADTTGGSDTSNALELGNTVWEDLTPSGQYGATKTLVNSIPIRKFLGVQNLVDGQEYQGTVIANPVEQVYFHALCYGVKGGTADVFMQVKIEYDAWFLEPRELTAGLAKQMEALLMADFRKQIDAQCESKNQPTPPLPKGVPTYATAMAKAPRVIEALPPGNILGRVIPRATIKRAAQIQPRVLSDSEEAYEAAYAEEVFQAELLHYSST